MRDNNQQALQDRTTCNLKAHLRTSHGIAFETKKSFKERNKLFTEDFLKVKMGG